MHHQGWYNTYEGKKVSRVAMCEVRSIKKRSRKNPKQNKIVTNNEKKWTVMNPSDVEWKNVAHPVDKTANWCIGGCWFT